MSDLEIEIEENRQLKLEMDALTEKIKQLNRINNQLVFSYTNIWSSLFLSFDQFFRKSINNFWLTSH